MATNRKILYLVCYDISDPRRLGRVHRYLKRVGIPMQYSVFLLHIKSRDLDRVISILNALMDLREDDIRIYPLPQKPDWQCWGRSIWPEGITLEGIALPDHHDMLK